MKITIIISLLIICSVCKGQGIISSDTSTVGNGAILFDGSIFTTQANDSSYIDTIKIMMLVTDEFYPNNKVIKLIGYEERTVTAESAGSHQHGDLMWFNRTAQYSYTHNQYLDIAKHPLEKSITVWMCKEIK